MLRFVVRFLVTRLSPVDLIDLGALLVEAGEAAQRRQAEVTRALAQVRSGVDSLTQ